MFRTAAISSLALALAACGNGKDVPDTPQSLTSETGGETTLAPAAASQTDPVATIGADLPKADAALIEIYKKLHANPELSFKEALVVDDTVAT